MRTNVFPIDLLQKLSNRSHNRRELEEEEEIELSLDLSLNGRFGVDSVRKKLKRSSSIADNGIASHAAEFGRHALLSKTRSLPTESEEEWRRRKEYQSMRRMEAKKKRMQKLKNLRGIKETDEAINGSVNNGLIASENGNEISSPIGSQRSGSSGLSDAEFLIKDGGKEKAHEAPCSIQHRLDEPGSMKLAMQSMPEMPHVSTTIDGRTIQGFLYRYKTGEQVGIVCVCHGEFLTPAKFVEHAGGADVDHPMKHILVNPFPL